MQEEVMKMTIWHTIRREQIHIGKGINTLPALPEESTQITVMSLITHVMCGTLLVPFLHPPPRSQYHRIPSPLQYLLPQILDRRPTCRREFLHLFLLP